MKSSLDEMTRKVKESNEKNERLSEMLSKTLKQVDQMTTE